MQREFAARNENICIGSAQFGIKATAFLGVVCMDKGMSYYELFPRSVNKERFWEFLKHLKSKHGHGKLILYLDNLSCHKNVETRKLYHKLDIVPVFAPVYSPELNPIEYVFAMLKKHVKQMRLSDMIRQEKRTFDDLVPIAVDKLNVQDINHCIGHVYKRYNLKLTNS